jgi:hypothetical protein
MGILVVLAITVFSWIFIEIWGGIEEDAVIQHKSDMKWENYHAQDEYEFKVRKKLGLTDEDFFFYNLS